MRESKIRTELERLALLHDGELRPETVVEAARPETSPLHGSFEWDDNEAAHQWRLQQARQLIRVIVNYEPVAGRQEAYRVFVSLTPDRQKGGAGYRLMTAVMSNEAHRAQMLADAVVEMKTFRHKYQRLRELSEVFAAMARVEETADPVIAATAEAATA